MATPMVSTDFPLPPDVEGFWLWEKGHFPRPATPLTQDLLYRAITDGFSGAMQEWACPFGIECRALQLQGVETKPSGGFAPTWTSLAGVARHSSWQTQPGGKTLPSLLTHSRVILLLARTPIPMSASGRQSKPEKDCWARRGSG
jgi:hypothetical protein